MKQSEKTLLEFAGHCYIHKPELANELNTLIADFINKPKEQLSIPRVSSSYVVFEDGSDEGIEGMIQLSVPFKTIEEAQAYASSWRSRKTYVAKMIE